jgi:hypothetical protein
VDSASEAVEPLRPDATTPALPHPRRPSLPRLRSYRISLERVRSTILVYLGTRALLLVVAAVNGALRHHSFTHELANWDGLWYRELAHHGYPTHVPHAESTLGFFPLYPMVTWLTAHVFVLTSNHSFLWSLTVAGIIVSGIGGLVAAVLVHRLAADWWGEDNGRRAAWFFCLFPGSVVFSMVYAEGLVIPLAAGCLLALQRRRWLLAGVLAAVATASEPEALVLIVVCAVSAAAHIRRSGWRDRAARRSLIAPALSTVGAGSFAVFLWARTGTPFASLLAQHYGWHEKTDPFALVHLANSLANQISFAHFNHPTINLNLVVGLVGALVLVVLLVLLYRVRRTVSIEALVWTAGISFLAMTSEFTPPNPRLIITAFPAVLVVGRYLRGRTFTAVQVLNGGLLAGLSALTFIGTTLRP